MTCPLGAIAVSGSFRPWPVRTQTAILPRKSAPARWRFMRPATEAAEAGSPSSSQRVAEYVKALQEEPAPAAPVDAATATGNALAAIAKAAVVESQSGDEPKRKLRLLERISSAGKA